MHPEQAAFEANIDRNPLDATNHLVYADWLDENGQPEEAAFRRAMGEWIHRTPGVGTNPSPISSHNWWVGGRLSYPSGVSLENMDFPRQAGYPTAPRIGGNDPPHYPAAHRNRDQGDVPTSYGHLGFSTYRGMEEAMRRAFRRGQQKKLSRRIHARRISLKRRRGG